MKKILIIVMVVSMTLAFCSCGSDEPEQTALSPTDIQAEQLDDGGVVYTLVYDIDAEDTEQWSGHFTHDDVLQTAIDGIKTCMGRDDWTDNSVIYGEDRNGLTMYSYGDDGLDGNYTQIRFYQVGIFDRAYDLQGELEQ